MCSITSSASTIRADATRPSATSVRYSSRRLKKLRFVSTEPAAGQSVIERTGSDLCLDTLNDLLQPLSIGQRVLQGGLLSAPPPLIVEVDDQGVGFLPCLDTSHGTPRHSPWEWQKSNLPNACHAR